MGGEGGGGAKVSVCGVKGFERLVWWRVTVGPCNMK